MGNALVPGNLSPAAVVGLSDPKFADSMAEAIEQELDFLMRADNLPGLDFSASHQTVRDRRRFFVAIARGVVRHLQDNHAAIATFCLHDHTMPVTKIDVDYR